MEGPKGSHYGLLCHLGSLGFYESKEKLSTLRKLQTILLTWLFQQTPLNYNPTMGFFFILKTLPSCTAPAINLKQPHCSIVSGLANTPPYQEIQTYSAFPCLPHAVVLTVYKKHTILYSIPYVCKYQSPAVWIKDRTPAFIMMCLAFMSSSQTLSIILA